MAEFQIGADNIFRTQDIRSASYHRKEVAKKPEHLAPDTEFSNRHVYKCGGLPAGRDTSRYQIQFKEKQLSS